MIEWIDWLKCSDKIVPKHKFLFKLSLVFCCGRHHCFYGSTKNLCTCLDLGCYFLIVSDYKSWMRYLWNTIKNRCFVTLRMRYLWNTIKNRCFVILRMRYLWNTIKNRCFVILNLLPCRSQNLAEVGNYLLK